jgi:hypothetical protein
MGVAQEVGKASQGLAGVAQEVQGGCNPDCLLVVDPPWPEVAELGAAGARGRPRKMQDAGGGPTRVWPCIPLCASPPVAALSPPCPAPCPERRPTPPARSPAPRAAPCPERRSAPPARSHAPRPAPPCRRSPLAELAPCRRSPLAEREEPAAAGVMFDLDRLPRIRACRGGAPFELDGLRGRRRRRGQRGRLILRGGEREQAIAEAGSGSGGGSRKREFL